MTRLLFAILFLPLISTGQNNPPGYQWAIGAGSSEDDQAVDILADNHGNLYTTGRFESFFRIEDSIWIAASPQRDHTDAFVMKQNRTGEVIWVKAFGGPGVDEGVSLAFDRDSSLIIGGSFSGSVQFGQFTLNDQGEPLDTERPNEMFLLRIDPKDGDVKNAISFGGDRLDQLLDMAVDQNGNLTFLSVCSSEMVKIGDLFSGYNVSQKPSYLLGQLDNAFDLEWSKWFFPPERTLSVVPTSAEIITQGQDLYMAAFIADSIISEDTAFYVGERAYSMLKLDESGRIIGHQAFTGGFNMSFRAGGIALDEQHHLYAIGTWSRVLQIDSLSLQTTGPSDIRFLMAKFDSLGHLIWVHTINERLFAEAIHINKDAIYIAGAFSPFDTIELPIDTLYRESRFGGLDGILIRFDENAQTVWARIVGGEVVDGYSGISSNSKGDLFTSGRYLEGYTMIDSFILDHTPGFVDDDIWIGYLGRDSVRQDTLPQPVCLSLPMLIFPNPFVDDFTVQFSQPIGGTIGMEIIDSSGRQLWHKRYQITESVKQIEVNAETIPAGMYFLRIRTSTAESVMRIVNT